MTLTGLVPGDRYQFKVYAVSDGQYSQSEIVEESIRKSYIHICVHWWVTENNNNTRKSSCVNARGIPPTV